MFTNEPNEAPIDELITDILTRMDETDELSEEYPKLMSYLERLHNLKASNRREPVSRDTLAIVAGNLMVALIMVVYEQKHVITSKALNQLIRPKA